MAGLYDSLRTIAGETIDQYGVDINLYRKSDVYDYTTGKRVGDPSPESVRSAPPDQWVESSTGGRPAPTEDMRFIIPGTALETAPATGDRVEYGDRTYTVVEVTPIWAGTTVVLWMVRARI